MQKGKIGGHVDQDECDVHVNFRFTLNFTQQNVGLQKKHRIQKYRCTSCKGLFLSKIKYN